MKSFLIIFLVLSSTVLSSCSSTKSYIDHPIKAPLVGDNQSVLYKVGIEVFGDFFSGLVLFKYNEDQQDFNIVLLSEVGLTLCEFYSNGQTMEVRKASSLFSSKAAQRTLAEDFSYLLHQPGLSKQVADYEYKNTDKVRYTIDTHSAPSEIRKKRLINGVKVDLGEYKDRVPSQINFRHRGINFKMKLTLLKLY